MGTWGAGLYSDDTAADLKNTIALLNQLPVSGDGLLEIAIEAYGESVELTADGGPTFWLVVADQFERKGIRSERVFQTAREAIAGGADLRDLKARGMDAGGLKKRAKILGELAERLKSPRPTKPRPKAGTPPPFVVEPGAVYSFPTMRGQPFNAWFKNWEEARFTPDGWGAMVVLAVGREFEWLPWCAVASLTVEPSKTPTLADAASARLRDDAGARFCVPRRPHLDKMQMKLLGNLDIDPKKAAGAISDEHTSRAAVTVGWSFVSVLIGWTPGTEGGMRVADLTLDN
jgi:hypothetical protein